MASLQDHANRYRPIRKLGEGGAGEVWLVDDLAHGRTVALKKIVSPGPAAVAALRAEFSRLAALQHPGLARAFEFHVGDKSAYFTMEFVDGSEFVESARKEGVESLIERTVEALRTLAFLHSFDVLHRDLKPANLLVRSPSHLGTRIALVDFGLATSRRSDEGSPALAGTLAYLAPELLKGGGPTVQTDLYALGATVFEAVHGRPLIDSRGLDELNALERLTGNREELPPIPQEFPQGLGDWLHDMLAADPRDRPSLASEALARLNRACSARYALETNEDRRWRMQSGSPPGREKEIGQIWESLAQSKSVLLGGVSGSGKSRLAQWIGCRAVEAGWDVRWSLDSPLSNTATETLTILDDAEALDAETIRQLQEGVETSSSGGARVLITFTPSAVMGTPLENLVRVQDLLPGLNQVEIQGMSSNGTRAIAHRASGSPTVPDELVDWLQAESEGNPRLIEALLVDRAWENRTEVAPSLLLDESIQGRITDLKPQTRRWLESLAIIGSASESELRATSSLDGSTSAEAAADARRVGLAVERGGRWAFAGRTERTGVLDQISVERRAEICRRAIEVGRDQDPARLARLWKGVGDRTKAIECSLQAGQASQEQGDYEAAAKWFRFALAQLPRRDSRRREIRSRHANALKLADRYMPAARAFAATAVLTQDPADRALLRLEQARFLSLAGRFARARDAVGRARAEKVPASRRDEICGIAAREEGRTLLIQNEESEAIPVLERAAGHLSKCADPRLLAESRHLEGLCHSKLRRLSLAEDRFREAASLAESSEDFGLRAAILIAYAAVEQRRFQTNRGLELLEQARGLLRGTNFPRRELSLLLNLGILTAYAGRLDESLELGAEAYSVALRLASRTHAIHARLLQADALIEVGRPSEGASTAEKLLDLPASSMPPMFSSYARYLLAGALIQLPSPRLSEAAAHLRPYLTDSTLDPRSRMVACVTELERLAVPPAAGDIEATWADYKQAAAKLGTDADHSFTVRALLARGYHAWYREDLDTALAAAMEGLRIADEFDQPSLAARTHGLLSEVHEKRGDLAAAATALERGQARLREAAERIRDEDVRGDFMQRTVFRSLRREISGGVEPGETRLLAIYDMVRALNSETDPAFLLESMMDMALRVVQAERGMVLLREPSGEFVVRVARNLEQETIRDATEFSHSVVLQAGEGNSVLAMDTGQDERLRALKSVSLFNIRSVLCVPLRSRGEVTGAVYLDSRDEGTLFSREDLRFLEAFADHAALALQNAQIRAGLERRNRQLAVAAESRSSFADMIGRSAPMQRVYDMIERFAESALPVLIQGESGTGKELVARAIHTLGPRRRRPYLTENCAAIAESLLESELFGHVKGAFTGADRDRVGLFEQAHQGTLFLDEIGDMPLPMQARLLRVLQEGELRPVGGETRTKVDVRVLAATHRRLDEEVRAGKFRQDLLYRLQVLLIELPPLRERPGDVHLLIDHFLEQISRQRDRTSPPLRSEVRELLERNDWPGNVRQLESAVQRLVLLAGDKPIDLGVVESDPGLTASLLGEDRRTQPVFSLQRNEKERIRDALEAAEGHRGRAAKLLGISRATIFRKLKQYDLG